MGDGFGGTWQHCWLPLRSGLSATTDHLAGSGKTILRRLGTSAPYSVRWQPCAIAGRAVLSGTLHHPDKLKIDEVLGACGRSWPVVAFGGWR